MSYNRKKEEIKDIYSPSSRKALTPNYYQKKGRSIQNSVGFIPNPDTEIITQETLDRYYRTLLRFKYKFAGVENYPSPFNFFISKTLYDWFNANPVIDPEHQTTLYYQYTPTDFKNECMSIMRSNYSQIADLYSWHFAMVLIQFYTGSVQALEAQQCSIDNFDKDFHGGIGLFQKSLDPPVQANQVTTFTYLRPQQFVEGHVVAGFLKFTTTGEGLFFSNALTIPMTDTNYNDNGSYPFMVSDLNTSFSNNLIFTWHTANMPYPPRLMYMNAVVLAYPRPLNY